MKRSSKNVLDLQDGDHIVVDTGRPVQRVIRPSTPGEFNTVTIHTATSDITTTLPCWVTVVTP